MALPLLLPRSHSASLRSFCSSDESSITADSDEDVRSDRIQDFFESFDAVKRFSQVDAEGGRGTQEVREMHALLVNVWMRREEQNLELCLDRHNERQDRTIYYPTRRQPNGIVVPGRMAAAEENTGPVTESLNIVDHHVSIKADEQVHRSTSETKAESSSKRRKVQSTLLSLAHGEQTGQRRNQGRFVKKSLAPIAAKKSTTAIIPLAPRGIRDILRQWVLGDPTKNLETPLCQCTYEMINAKSPTGKSNKSLYSKGKVVSVAVLLMLREAVEKKTSLADIMGVSNDGDMSELPLTAWEKYFRQYLREPHGRRMSKQEIIALGNQVYKNDYLELLPR